MMLLLVSCTQNHADIMKEFKRLKESKADPYTLAYSYASYLSTSTQIKPEEAIPLINELISMAYPTAARYCIDNLERNGIRSFDLLALHGLCYQHELQPLLAGADLEAALKGDPGNEKIMTLLNNLRRQSPDASDLPMHEALFRQGLACIQQQEYDSALHFIKKAIDLGNQPEYEPFIARIENVIEGEKMIFFNPLNHKGYLVKSHGLAAMKEFGAAQITLDGGLIACPGNVNLILAKALVWVQGGNTETARQYLLEQEQQGIAIDPSVKQRILQPQN